MIIFLLVLCNQKNTIISPCGAQEKAKEHASWKLTVLIWTETSLLWALEYILVQDSAVDNTPYKFRLESTVQVIIRIAYTWSLSSPGGDTSQDPSFIVKITLGRITSYLMT